ncbi:MAG: ABC transporter substrate-binding protein [Hyphomicrobiales bacterium]|nr:ABC transporter substrate-binding protein [Hyphomicrobiales bacterium]
MSMSVKVSTVLAAGLLAGVSVTAAQAQSSAPTKITIGTVKSLGSIASYIAKDKGYFKQAGLDVNFVLMNSTSNVMGVFAKGDIHILEGGMSLGYYNAVALKYPIIVASDRVSTPIQHRLLVGMQHKGKIAKLSDLKGKVIGTNAVGSVTTYEVGKMFSTVGLTLKDINLKVVPFPQMGVALKNGALDATVIIPPFAAKYEEQGLGFALARPDDLVKPSPMTIAVTFVNTDWAAKNRELVKKFYVAYLKATREYCIAYHKGPNRKEVVDIGVRNGLAKTAADIEATPWTGRNLDGHVNIPSIMDMQAYYVENKLVKQPSKVEALVTDEYIKYANAQLGPLPKMPESSDPGCR